MAIKASNQITFSEHKKIIEIKEWYLATNKNTGVTRETEGWTENIQAIDYSNNYLWNYEEVVYSIGEPDLSDPVIISSYGKGIANIVNYYQITQKLVAPELPKENEESAWSDVSVVTELSSINKYLWNYEAIVYTDGTITNTEPAIVGVYGDSGIDAITFEIYSTQGFIFKEDMSQIELKIAAFKGADSITNATYTWEWWNDTLNDGAGGYETIIENSDKPDLIVNYSDEFAFSSLRCTMTYDNRTYEDYIVLTSETVIYTSTVNFVDGSNIFYADDLYLIAYVELYQNGRKIETIATDKYCSGLSSISDDGTIVANLSDEKFIDGDKMYFVYQDKDGLYQVILGEYTSGTWKVTQTNLQYIYTNSLYNSIQSNIIAISKESVNKSRNIKFVILKGETDISNVSANVIDSNDPIISSTTPENPVNNQLWLDTSTNPGNLKIYSEEKKEWLLCAQQSGNAIYTSKPSKYTRGDLWILSDGEVCGSFGPGSMLKATTTSNTFNQDHWIDADAEMTNLKNNINQYFEFNKNTGLKIGQADEKFYVNIRSTEMGFYDNSTGQNQKVVSISNNSANIKNLTVDDSATFNANTKFNSEVNFFGFVWKKESNGSLSLAISS